MIKIIKEGKKKIPVYKAKCPLCECAFEFNNEDVENMIQDGPNNVVFAIHCPNCDRELFTGVNPVRYDIVKD